MNKKKNPIVSVDTTTLANAPLRAVSISMPLPTQDFGGMSTASSQEAVSLIDTNHDWKAASIGRVHQSGARAVHPVTHTCTHSCGAVSCRHGMARPL